MALSKRRGIALIVVLLAMAVIVPLTIQFNRAVRLEIYEASNLGETLRLHYAARSGFNLGWASLASDKGTFDALNEDWADQGALNDAARRLFDNAEVRVVVEDEGGKIPLNQLVKNNVVNGEVREMLLRLLTLPEFRLEPEQALALVNAIKDWVDKDDVVTETGAETPYYANLPRPYRAKNGPLESLEELLAIKGVTKELYYGTEDAPGLVSCLTLYGTGAKININTAPRLVLQILSKDMTAEMIEEMDEYRRDPQNDLASPSWFRKLGSMRDVNVTTGWIEVKSDVFRISAQGKSGGMTETVSGVVYRDRNKQILRPLSWRFF